MTNGAKPMKTLAIVLSVIFLTGCGQNDPFRAKSVSSTKDQTAEISDRIKPYGVVNLSSEPTNFYGPLSAYVVNGSAVQVAVADALPGQAKYAACSACHGGNGEGGIGPMLAGQSADYIVGRLTQYKNGEQVGSQSALMWGQAGMLSEQDIADLGEYVEKGFSN